jgi:hypothetical protein
MTQYPEEFLVALNDWQKGWKEDQKVRKKKAKTLLGTLDCVPQEHKSAWTEARSGA